MNWEIDKKINLGGILSFLIIITTVISGFAYLQKDVATVQAEQERIEAFRQEVRSEYVTRDQLNYMVLQRFDRMEANIDRKFSRLEELIEGNGK